MNRKAIGIFVIGLLIATALPAVGTIKNESSTSIMQNPYVEWEYTYDGDEFDWFFDVQPTSDGGYIATGLTEEDNIYYAWLLKVDSDGVEKWRTINYEFNGTEIDVDILVDCVRQMPDGYLVGGIGRFYSTVHGVWAVAGYLWKTNENGVTEWQKELGNEVELWYLSPSVFEYYDDTGLICGGSYVGITSPPDYFLDVALFKVDFNGDLLWYETYDLGYNCEWARSLDNTSDGGYFLSGTSYDNNNVNDGGFAMVKTDDVGNLNWSSIFDGGGFDYSPGMGGHQTSDGGYIMSGISDSFTGDDTDLWIVKADSDGNMDWNKTYGGPNNDRSYGMDATEDGGFVFVVIKNAYEFGGTKEDTWIINTDDMGNLEWEVLIEEDETQWAQSIVQTSDEGFIVGGRTGAMGSSASDGLLIKLGPFPHFEIEIKGGFGVEVSITNDGLGDVVDVPYELTVTGGIIGLINETITGTIDLDAGATESISSGLIFGLGSIEIKVTVGVKEKIAKGTQILIFTLVQ